MKAVINAGGLGTRLSPLTDYTPKALIPIANTPIIDIIIYQLESHGIDDIVICLNHRKNEIISHIKNKNHHLNISFSIEKKKLGPIGALSLIRNKLNEPFLYMYCDSLTKIDYTKFIDTHKLSKNLITLALHSRKSKYGICTIHNDLKLDKFTEKPCFLIYTGIAIFDPIILSYISDNAYLDDFELIELLKSNRVNIGTYTFTEYWTDIGTIGSYKKACEEWKWNCLVTQVFVE